jgi:hypothetical protein
MVISSKTGVDLLSKDAIAALKRCQPYSPDTKCCLLITSRRPFRKNLQERKNTANEFLQALDTLYVVVEVFGFSWCMDVWMYGNRKQIVISADP